MDIKTAREEDLIDVLYLLKQEIATTCEDHPAPPSPDYRLLREEIEQGTLYIMEHHKISIGTFALQPAPAKDINTGGPLQVNHLTIASYWINNETLREILAFLEDMGSRHRFSRLRLTINRHNNKMNTFCQDVGFTFLMQDEYSGTSLPYNVYEKNLAVD